jgi:hypothetical protein
VAPTVVQAAQAAVAVAVKTVGTQPQALQVALEQFYYFTKEKKWQLMFIQRLLQQLLLQERHLA